VSFGNDGCGREVAAVSLEGRRLDLLTISGNNSVQPQRELVPAGLFPEAGTTPRAHKFHGKKVTSFMCTFMCSHHVC
jgi:hypothetical protein